MKQLGVLGILFAVTLGAFAQETGRSADSSSFGADTTSFGVVIYAEGNTLSVIRDLRRREYDAFTGELLGFALYPGDRIQTDPDTYVEIQLLPSRSVVKVAENTSFTIEQVSASGEGVFNLSYGRLRARVNRLAGQAPFEIRGVGATAGVRGTDFGTDVTVAPNGGASLTRIYCFEGEVYVEMTPAVVAGSANGASQAPVSETIVVGANQMVTATTLSPSAAAAAPASAVAPAVPPQPPVGPISSSITEYWQRKSFVAEVQDTDALLAQFPYLAGEATERLGNLAFLHTNAPARDADSSESTPSVAEQVVVVDAAVDEPVVAEPPRRAAPQGLDAVAIGGEAEVADAERQQRLIGATRAAGITMTAIGFLAEAAAVTGYFWGAQILPDWPPASDTDVLVVVAASGGVLLIGGILSLLFSLQLGQ